MRLLIPGEAVPKERPRINRKTGSVYTPRATRAFEQAIALMAMAAGDTFGKDTVKLSVLFYTAKRNPADVDNCIKSVLDGCQMGRVFDNDSQVVLIEAVRVKSRNPRTEIVVESCEEMEEDAD